MRTLTIRFAVLIAAFAVISPSALAQEPSGGATAPAAAPAPAPFRLSGGGGALLGKKVRFRGTVDAKLAGRPVVVQSFDPVTEAWTKQAKATVKPDGTFLARWKARKIGQFRTRALIGGSARTAVSVARAHAHGLPPRDRHLVRPRLLRQQDRLRDRADRDARRRRPPHAAVRHASSPSTTARRRSSPRSSTAARSAARRSGT